MKYKIELSKSVEKFLIKHKEVTKRFVQKVEILSENISDPILDVKALSGAKKWNYRLRIGKRRFLFEVQKEKILIYFYDADSRGDIYK